VTAFLGVPYGAAPVGPLRFADPVPAGRWEGVRTATVAGPAPIQGAPSPGRFLADLSSPVQSEDCLNLSVWTPSADPAAKLPVMVWFYGGAFVAGSNSVPAYDGARLAARGAVVVGVNYRLGVFGWLRSEALGADGNQGLADQAAALAWVGEHISAFGGDAGNVTVFGESAGAASIALHLAGFAAAATPAANLPFRRAVLQSGSFNLCSTVAEADDTAARVLRHLGVAPSALRDLPASVLRDAQDEATPRAGGVFYRPVTDGGRVPVDPAAALADRGVPVPVLCGTNRHEMGFFWGREERFDRISDEFLAALAGRWHADPAGLLDTYRQARSARGEAVDNRSVAVAVGNDWTFRAASMALAAWQSDRAGAHAYRLDWCSPLHDGLVGAAHVLDVPLVFGTYEHPSVAAFCGSDVALDEVAAVSDEMGAAWVAFARDGDPGWPAYEPVRRTTRLFGGATPTTDDPEGVELRCWDARRLHR
jgi:para-nitrobenzyl esterase